MAFSASELKAGARIMAEGQDVESFLKYAIMKAAQQVGPLGSELRQILGK